MKKQVFLLMAVMGLTIVIITQLNAAEILSVSEDYPPFEYTENDRVTGFTVALVDELYKRSGHTGKVKIYPWARAYNIALNKPNILVHRMTRSSKREKLFKWVGKIVDKRVSLFKLKSRKDIDLSSLEEAKQYRVGTIRDQSSTKFMYKKGFVEGQHVFSVKDVEANVNKLMHNRVDLILSMEPVLQFKVNNMGISYADQIEEAVIVDNSSEFWMAFSMQTPDETVDAFRRAFKQIESDGTFDRLMNQYVGK